MQQGVDPLIHSLFVLADLFEPTLIDAVDGVTKCVDVLLIVTRQDDRLPFFFERQQKFPQTQDTIVIECIECLIQDQDVLLFHDGLRDCELLFLRIAASCFKFSNPDL